MTHALLLSTANSSVDQVPSLLAVLNGDHARGSDIISRRNQFESKPKFKPSEALMVLKYRGMYETESHAL